MAVRTASSDWKCRPLAESRRPDRAHEKPSGTLTRWAEGSGFASIDRWLFGHPTSESRRTVGHEKDVEIVDKRPPVLGGNTGDALIMFMRRLGHVGGGRVRIEHHGRRFRRTARQPQCRECGHDDHASCFSHHHSVLSKQAPLKPRLPLTDTGRSMEDNGYGPRVNTRHVAESRSGAAPRGLSRRRPLGDKPPTRDFGRTTEIRALRGRFCEIPAFLTACRVICHP